MPQSSNEKRQSRLKTPFLRVPTVDWAKVRCGEKREFRQHPNGGGMPFARNIPFFPIVVVAYAQFMAGRDEELMLLEDAWVEPLRAITQEGLEREGFQTRQEFKVYWGRRHRRGGWRALSNVVVVRVRPLEPEEMPEHMDRLFQHFYGHWR